MSNYTRGREKEYRAIKLLEEQGYYCIRSAGSHTVIDVIAFLQKNGLEMTPIRAIQIKSGRSPYKKDLKKLQQLSLPFSVSKELWRFIPRKKHPEIIVVEN